MAEPTVHVRQTCSVCDGTGRREAVVHEEGRKRTMEPAGNCDACGGQGELDEWLPVSKFRELLASEGNP